jgi:hypothetical protein
MSTFEEDLVQQQEELEQQSQEQQQEKEPAAPQEDKDEVLIAFANLANGPGPDQVSAWKEAYGDIRIMAFESDEIYVYRTIRRVEWKKFIAEIKEGPGSDLFQEQVVKKCVLWPSLDLTWSATCKAGTIPTLFEVIMEASNFLNPQTAIMLTRKL